MPSKAETSPPQRCITSAYSGNTSASDAGATSATARWRGKGASSIVTSLTSPRPPDEPMNSLAQRQRRVVLLQPLPQTQDPTRRLRQHDFQCQRVGAHVTVAQHPRAAGVVSDHAADRRIGAEVDGEPHAVRLKTLVDLRQPEARRHAQRAIEQVEFEDLAQPLGAEQHLAVRIIRRGRADQPGVRALHHHTKPASGRERQHARRLVATARTHERGGPPGGITRRLQEARLDVRAHLDECFAAAAMASARSRRPGSSARRGLACRRPWPRLPSSSKMPVALRRVEGQVQRTGLIERRALDEFVEAARHFEHHALAAIEELAAWTRAA